MAASASRRTDPKARSSEKKGVGRSVLLPLSFVLLALVTLAIVPLKIEQRRMALEERVQRDLAPIQLLLAELVSKQNRQMALVEQYVSTGDRKYRAEYAQAMAREDSLFGALRASADSLLAHVGPSVTDLQDRRRTFALAFQEELSLALGPLSRSWHILQSPLMEGEINAIAPSDFAGSLDRSREFFEDIRGATRSLEDKVIAEALAAQAEQQRNQAIRLWTTVFSILLAVFASVAILVVARNLRKLASREEQRRREAVTARREIRAVLRGTSEGVMGIDLEGLCTFLNVAGERLLGYSVGEVRGRPVHELIHHTRVDGSARGSADCPVRTTLDSGEPSHVADDVLWRKDGTSFPVQLSTIPMTDGLDVRGVVLTFGDMTEIRRTESALRDAVQARDDVIAVVSHDLRNPVGTVAAAAELIQDIPLTEERRAEHLDIIRRSADRMSRLIDDLLDVVRLDAGHLKVEPSPEAVGELIQEAVALSSHLAGQAGVNVHVGGTQGVPRVMADRERVLQILANLIGNALQVTPAGGEITIRAVAEEARAVVSVADTGPGVPDESRSHLFDRFWSGGSSGGKGAGLGLAIVKGLVEAHAGEVWVESDEGEGATFSFSLPLAEKPRSSHEFLTTDA
ncbi:MAG: ATP-binding protein [Longimicrobiales bacterium]